MAKNRIGDILSRLRTQIKAVRQDSFLTDRDLYAFVIKHAKWLMKREDSKNRLMAFSSVMQTLDFVELIEVDKADCGLSGISSDCTIKRTKEKVPVFMQGYYGPLVRTVASLDGSEELQPVLPSTYIHLTKSTSFKYNKTKYYWYLDDYMYFPNLEWDAVRVEGIFEDDISVFTSKTDSCVVRSDQSFNVPDYILAEMEQNAVKDLAMLMQVPADTSNDKQNILRA
jgi:hypothetical protein